MGADGLSGDDLLNAAAVWFIFKAIEVGIFLVYDLSSAIAKRRQVISNSDPDLYKDNYDRIRGRLEYIWSGAGFFNVDLCRQKRPFLLFLSTIIPIVMFGLELLSVTLGNKTMACETSINPNIISSPSLVFFGDGRRHGNTSSVLEEIRSFRHKNFSWNPENRFRQTSNAFRPCVSWSSINAGVQYLSSICVDVERVTDHYILSNLLSTSTRRTGLFLPLKKGTIADSGAEELDFYADAYSLQPNSSALGSWLGSLKFTSEVIVNSKNILYQNAFISKEVSEVQKEQLILDVRAFEKYLGQDPSEILEYGDLMGFIWDNAEIYASYSVAFVYGMLAQITKEPIKTAAEMSPRNKPQLHHDGYDISCQEDFELPKIASVIIIVICATFRLIFFLTPKPISSIEFAMKTSEEDPVSSESTDELIIQSIASKENRISFH